MKRTLGSIAAVIVFGALLTGGVLITHHPVAPRLHAVLVSPSPSTTPSALPTSTPTASKPSRPAPAAPAPASPTTQPVATLQSPLPSPVPSPVVPDPTPSPTPDPSAPPPPPVQPLPSPSPTPVQAPVCSWSVTVQTLANDGSGGWGTLGTWNGSAVTSTSPIFITGVSGWLQYTFQFSDVCAGHASITSYYVLSGQPIYTDSTGSGTRQANIPAGTEVEFVVTVQ